MKPDAAIVDVKAFTKRKAKEKKPVRTLGFIVKWPLPQLLQQRDWSRSRLSP
jgi:hypothetical protein